MTVTGLSAGLIGSLIIAATATALTPFCTGDMRKREGGSAGWALQDQIVFMLAIAGIGLGGSLLDSLLGAVLQASVVDVRTGKVIEGEGGGKVLVHSAGSLNLKQRQKVAERTGMSDGDVTQDLKNRKGGQGTQKAVAQQSEHHESRKIAVGKDILSNNGVNLVMAASMSLVAMIGAAWTWKISPLDIMSEIMR